MGAWIETERERTQGCATKVAPYMGAWIETAKDCVKKQASKSHPIWVRGLKLVTPLRPVRTHEVAPYMGAWIETIIRSWRNLST